MIFLMAMLPFFLVAPLIQALKRGVQKNYIVIITLLLLCIIFSTIFRISASYEGLIWIITFLIASFAQPNPDAASKNKKFIFMLYMLATLADCILIPLMLTFYTH